MCAYIFVTHTHTAKPEHLLCALKAIKTPPKNVNGKYTARWRSYKIIILNSFCVTVCAGDA